MVEPASKPSPAEPVVESHPLQALLRFVRAVRYRKEVVLVTLVVAAVLGGLYYGSVARVYQSGAEMLIQQTDTSKEINIPGINRDAQDYMETYRSVILSEAVLEPALNSLSPENRIDFQDVAAEKCIAKLQKNLQVTIVRKTSILQVNYRSRKPEAAAAVVNAVLTSFQKYVDKVVNHSAGEILATLAKEKSRLEGQIHATENELVKLRSEIGTVYSGNAKQGTDLITMQVFNLQKQVNDCKDKRVQAQALMESIQDCRPARRGSSPLFHPRLFRAGPGRAPGNRCRGRTKAAQRKTLPNCKNCNRSMVPTTRRSGKSSNGSNRTSSCSATAGNWFSAGTPEGGTRPLATILLEASRQDYERALNAERITKASFDEAKAKAMCHGPGDRQKGVAGTARRTA